LAVKYNKKFNFFVSFSISLIASFYAIKDINCLYCSNKYINC